MNGIGRPSFLLSLFLLKTTKNKYIKLTDQIDDFVLQIFCRVGFSLLIIQVYDDDDRHIKRRGCRS